MKYIASRRKTVLLAAVAILLITPAAYFAGGARDKAPAGLISKELLDNYLIMAGALAADSTKGISDASRRMEEIANSFLDKAAPESVTEEARKSTEMIAAHAKLLGDKSYDVETARRLFATISDELSWVFSTEYRGADRDKYHIFHCSMVGHYWLQKDAKIRNPYFGKSMLGCGDKVKEVARVSAPVESEEEYDPFAVVDAPPSERAEAIMKNLKCACCGKPLIPATCGCAAATGAKVKNVISEMEDGGMNDDEIINKLRDTFGAKVVPVSLKGGI